jgi:hypothetical protein
LDFNALILVMVSNRNLFVKRMGVSLMTIIEEDAGDNDEADAAVDAEAGCFRAAAVAVPVPDDGNKHLLYIVTVGRLNGIILHR